MTCEPRMKSGGIRFPRVLAASATCKAWRSWIVSTSWQLLIIRILLVDAELLTHAVDVGGRDVVGPIRQLRELGGDRHRILGIAQVRVDLDAYRRMGLLADRHGDRVALLHIVL